MLATALLLALALLAADQAQDGGASAATAQDDSGMPVSLERIREGLSRPQVLQMPTIEENELLQFRVEVTVNTWKEPTILERLGQELRASVPFSPPAGINLLSIAASIKDKIVAARRAQAERSAQRTVLEELAAFCEVNDCRATAAASPNVPDP